MFPPDDFDHDFGRFKLISWPARSCGYRECPVYRNVCAFKLVLQLCTKRGVGAARLSQDQAFYVYVLCGFKIKIGH